MKKTIIRIGVAALFAIVSFTVIKAYVFPTQSGSKEVQIIFEVDQEVGDNLVVLDITTKTDALTVGDLLDEIVLEEKVEISYSGLKSDTYGRYILGYGDYVTTDSATGPWWLFNSTTNKDCVDAGFCSGIDLAPVYDQDIFVFTFTSTY
jgi:hypothetical protein